MRARNPGETARAQRLDESLVKLIAVGRRATSPREKRAHADWNLNIDYQKIMPNRATDTRDSPSQKFRTLLSADDPVQGVS